MGVPLEITLRDMKRSPAVVHLIRKCVAELEECYEDVVRCRVLVHAPHRRDQETKLFQARIDLTLPGGEMVVNGEATAEHSYRDVEFAIREAFKTAAVWLGNLRHREVGPVPLEDIQVFGWISRVVPEDGYGFIRTDDGREVYFHRTSIINVPLERAGIGSEVVFFEHPRLNGQASAVRVVGGPRQ